MINTIHENSVSDHRRYVRFTRLFTLGITSLIIPFLVQAFLGQGAVVVRAALILVTGLYCIHILLSQRLIGFRRRPGYLILIISLLASRPLVELIHGEFNLMTLVSFAATGLIFWALWSLNPVLEWFRIAALFGCVVALLALAMSVLTPQIAFMVTELGNIQGSYKTSAERGLLAGPFENANTLGIVLATSVPFVFLWSKTSTQYLILTPILIALWMTVARTSLIATGIVLFSAIFIFKRNLSINFRKIVSFLFVGGAAAVQVALPFATSDPSFFTGRGSVWLADLAAWKRHPWFGNGETWHAEQSAVEAEIMHIGQTSSHNTALGWLTFGGIFYFFCCIAVMILLIRASWAQLSEYQMTPIFLVIVLLVVGISESHWHVFSTSPLFFMHGFLVAGVIFCQPSGRLQNSVIHSPSATPSQFA